MDGDAFDPGTGFEDRAAQPCVAINCAGIPEGLLESGLFGHELESFTGAYVRKIGKLEAANGGTDRPPVARQRVHFEFLKRGGHVRPASDGFLSGRDPRNDRYAAGRIPISCRDAARPATA